MSDDKWSLEFRQDQCEFIVATMNYIVARADIRIGNGKYEPFDQFTAQATRERAVEIKEEIEATIS